MGGAYRAHWDPRGLHLGCKRLAHKYSSLRAYLHQRRATECGRCAVIAKRLRHARGLLEKAMFEQLRHGWALVRLVAQTPANL